MRWEHPGASERELVAQGKLKPFPGIPVSVLREEGREVTVVAIHWDRFTNDEIATCFRQWLKAKRPAGLGPPDAKRHNKARDWRVALERLGMLRLPHHARWRDMAAAYPQAWKLYGKRDCYEERTRADRMFRRLFPFLSTSERPLSWPTRGGRSRWA